MAEVKRNMILSGVSGSLGPDHYARITKDGRTIISLKPDFSNRQFSEAQLHVQSQTKLAAEYAKVASKVNPLYAEKVAGTSRTAYNLAFRDWRRPPVIRGIEWNHGQIRVRAHDDMLVTGVTVTILDEAGQILDQGDAELWMGVLWEYNTAHRGRIRVEARDRSGNVTCQEFSPPSYPYSEWKKPMGK